MKSKRGAPLGNTNARKSGLYSAHAKALFVEAFEKLSPDHLQGQIDGLRVFLDRFVRTKSPEPESHAQAREDLMAYTTASTHLVRLIRANINIQNISQSLQDTDDWLSKFLSEDQDDAPPADLPVPQP